MLMGIPFNFQSLEENVRFSCPESPGHRSVVLWSYVHQSSLHVELSGYVKITTCVTSISGVLLH